MSPYDINLSTLFALPEAPLSALLATKYLVTRFKRHYGLFVVMITWSRQLRLTAHYRWHSLLPRKSLQPPHRLFPECRFAPQHHAITINYFLRGHGNCSVSVSCRGQFVECDGDIYNVPSGCSTNFDNLDTCDSNTCDAATCVTPSATHSHSST